MIPQDEPLTVELSVLGPQRGGRLRAAAFRLGTGAGERAVGEGRGEQLLLGGAVGDGLGCDRTALGLVAVQQCRACPALEHGGELPADVHRVADAGVEAVSAPRGLRWAASPTRKTRPER
nr:hypothetical protein GCM10020093_034850 [Planobispora longispora]